VHEDVILNGSGELNMVNGLDSVSIGRDLLINRTRNLIINQGVLEVQRNINIPANITFRTEADAFMLLSGASQQKIAYPAGGTVEFKNLAVTNTSNFNHVMVTRGNITRNLNGERISGTCSNTNCTTTATCNNCKYIQIFTNLITIPQVMDRGVKIGNKPSLFGIENTILLGSSWTPLTATVFPSKISQAVTWHSTDTSVATVIGGAITLRAHGKTTITVTSTATGRTDSFVLTVIEPNHFASVNNFFDQGYADRSGGDLAAQSRITETQTLINATMLMNFSLNIGNNTPEKYLSPADACRTSGTSRNDQCNCLSANDNCAANSSTQHCKNVIHINNHFPPGALNSNTSKTATWTGHVTCWNFARLNVVCTGHNHAIFNRGGYGQIGGKRYTMAYENWFPITIPLRFELALHEMAHTFGIDRDTEHGICAGGYYSNNSIYLYNRGDVYDLVFNQKNYTGAFCVDCADDIKDYLQNNNY